MARVRICFHPFGTMRNLFKRPKVQVEMEEGRTVRYLIDLLAINFHPDIKVSLIDPQSEGLRQGVFLFLDGINLEDAEGLATELRDGQEVVVLRGDVAGGAE